MSAAVLLDKLEHVRPTGPQRWIARCPAHPDRRASLSIRELDDGRVLLHDFAGCETGHVLETLGLSMSDLFPKDAVHREHQSSSTRIPASDLLKIVSEDVTYIAVIAEAMLEHKSINERGWKLLAEAAARIGRARDYVR